MSLDNFKPFFDNTYQEIFQKVLVSMKIANTRFESMLTYGESVERVSYDISNAIVRDTVRGAASTIDTITDTPQLLNIDIEREVAFHLSDGEMKQAGPLNPGEVIGSKTAKKVAIDLDARVFGEVVNASQTFDTGDLTTTSSTGVPITLSTITVPQMVSFMPSKLSSGENQDVLSDMVMVVDGRATGEIAQYLMDKNIDLAGSVFKNGYTGTVARAELYASENLTGAAVLGMATQPTANDTVVINGLTFTFVASPSAEGDVDLGADVDETRLHLANALNQDATGAGSDYIAFTGADLATLNALNVVATNDDTANTLLVRCLGAGRLTVSETFTDGTDTWDSNYIECYFGKRGAIDLVTQDKNEVDMRPTSDRRGTNIFASYLAGIKTFTDGSKQFLNVKIAAV